MSVLTEFTFSSTDKTQLNMYKYVPPEKEWAKAQQRIIRKELRKAIRKASPVYACVEDNCERYYSDDEM